MGYELFITRADSTQIAGENPISKEEWDAVVVADPELEWSTDGCYERRQMPKRRRRPDGSIETVQPDHPEVERFRSVTWKGPHREVPLLHMDGQISVKNPDRKTCSKLLEIAGRLRARVLGEDDVEYSPD